MIDDLRDAVQRKNIMWSKHALIRLIERNIFQKEVLHILLN